MGILALIRQLVAQWKKGLGASFGPLLLAGGCVLTACVWLWEHDAHQRQAYELGQLKRQTEANVSALQAQAEAAIREANQQHARAVRELEARERKFAQDADALGGRVAALQAEEHARLEQVATLPASELVNRVAAKLGLEESGAGNSESVVRGPQSGVGGGEEEGAGSRGSGLGNAGESRIPNPEARRSQTVAREKHGEKDTGAAEEQRGEDTAATGTLVLEESGLRKVSTAFVELDSCRAHDALLSEQVANLNGQLSTQAAIIREDAASIEKLNQALEAKDQVMAQSEAEHRAELKAARGTRLGRAGRVLEHVAIGIAIGLVLR